MISQSRTPAGILRTLTAILCLAAILMSVTGSSAWAAPRVVRVVGIQDGISDSQADYFRRTIAELNDLTEDRIFVTRPIPAASSLDLNAYQGLDFAIVSPRVFALLERYNGFIPMASLSVDIPDCEPGAELRPVVSALVFATPDADEDGLAKPHLSDIAGETVTVVKGDEVDTTFLLQNELSSRRLAPVKVRVASDGGTPSEIIRRAVERGDKLFAVSTDLLRETSSDLFSGFVKVDMRVDDETGLVSSVTPMPGRVFAAGLSVARMGLLEFAATLFALDIAPDIHWVRPADYRSVHLAAERMRDPVYMSYQKKTLLEEMREHAAWVILAAAILIGLIWHSVAAERLVRRRSAELMETVVTVGHHAGARGAVGVMDLEAGVDEAVDAEAFLEGGSGEVDAGAAGEGRAGESHGDGGKGAAGAENGVHDGLILVCWLGRKNEGAPAFAGGLSLVGRFCDKTKIRECCGPCLL